MQALLLFHHKADLARAKELAWNFHPATDEDWKVVCRALKNVEGWTEPASGDLFWYIVDNKKLVI